MTNRTLKRKEKLHQTILETASELICERGSTAVSLEEISKYADVARKTIYNHFESKSALIQELVMPLCYHAMDRLAEMKEEGNISREDIWQYCLELWEDRSLKAHIFYHVNPSDYADFEENKHGFVYVFTTMLSLIKEFEHLDQNQLEMLGMLIYKTYIPLLESLQELERMEEMFINGMNGLLDGVLNE